MKSLFQRLNRLNTKATVKFAYASRASDAERVLPLMRA